MIGFFDERQLLHRPQRELQDGDWVRHVETPMRAESVRDALGTLSAPGDAGSAPLAAVHSADYLDFLQQAWTDWQAAGREGEAFGYTFPVVGRRRQTFERIEAKLGRYSFDVGTPIGGGTWEAAYWSAQCALAAARSLMEGDPLTFALCRPPGHHAGRDYFGGYCYLNNAAIAAAHLTAPGKMVAILDIDYHHGNGTQDLFYARRDVGFVSIHADPRTDYPFYWGHADERGEGDGDGYTLNLPLPRGTDGRAYWPALERACAQISAWGPHCLVVSFGADTFADDPISHFRLTTEDFGSAGRRIAALRLPVCVVMEGGYASPFLGTNVAAFLNGLGA